MSINGRIREGAIKGILIFSVSVISTLRSCTVQAQDTAPKPEAVYIGFDVSFGVRAFDISSNLEAINGMDVLEEGGTAGIIVGNKFAQVKLSRGYFYSAACVPFTSDMKETSLTFITNPLQIATTRFRSLEPYLLSGFEHNRMELYGNYGDKSIDQSKIHRRNNSAAEEPRVGELAVIRASVGLGLQYRVPFEQSFVRIFAQGRYGWALEIATNEAVLNQTRVSDQTSISLGVCFGYLK